MTARMIGIGALGAFALAVAGAPEERAPLVLARLALCGAALASAAVYDLREHRIPNRLVLPAAYACLALTAATGLRLADLRSAFALVIALLALSLARPEALGMGDVKLALLVAAGLDGHATPALALGLLLAALAGILLLARHGRAAGNRTLPLAPFIAAGSLLALLP